jgi:predicted O-methyltransferase YrrM
VSDRLESLFREFAAQQRLHEYLAVAERIRARLGGLGTVLEVGTAAGGTLALWAELSEPAALLVAVDLPQGPQPAYSDEALRRAAAGRRLALVRRDSRLPETRHAVLQALGPRQADFLFIDGSYRAAVVRSDLRSYGPFVRNGGLVAFHDVVVHPGMPDVRVHELWWELRARFPHLCEDVREAPDQDWGGIGLLTMTSEVRAYISAPERVPIFINNFNRLTSTRALAEWAAGLPGARVVILDNGSDWVPLLEWYERCPFEVRHLGRNYGHRAPWTCGAVQGVAAAHYVVTDPDLDMGTCPTDVLDVLVQGMARYPWAKKAGVGLELEDIPAGYPSHQFVRAAERPYWRHRLDERFFRAAVDTTFAVYRAGAEPPCAPALRSDRPYVARHLPWYVTPETLTDEERHYLRSAEPRFSSGTAHTRRGYGV